MYSYAKEKAYCARRAEEFTAEMEQAIAAKDADRFYAAYQKSARYMKRSTRMNYYKAFLTATRGKKA